ncbi:hypothetical protein DXG03_005560 [Asterophora parasitica]|uniref:Uncharacterized protein n=1 Tax=Asterophora parasitica TaxID=117018 RepID=A0A9P7KAX4_9AGAR|nr:hypothetical protein DXG03_005560 [Asterophora parasitica]
MAPATSASDVRVKPSTVSAMTDPASHRLSRSPSAVMSRPLQSPMGPRTRFQRTTSDVESVRDTIMIIGEPSPAYPLSARSDSLAPITSPPSAISMSSLSPAQPSPLFSPRTPASPATPSVFKVLPKPATLVSAPPLTFESVPVQWKALPHEAALWTFDSAELQAMVSRAIRRSAPETYIRLLSLENLDKVLPAEVERLTALKATKQAQYRFLVQRRTMTLQALNSSFISADKETEDGIPMASKLALQLSQTVAECDKLMGELLVISDQLAQISNMTDLHWASALAVALRKLNKSYAKRTQHLVAARNKISQLEAELEDAWKEAERVAKEIDDLEKAGLDSDNDDDDEGEEIEDETAIIETAEKIDVSRSRHASHIPTELLIPSRGNTGHMEALPVFSPLSPMPRISAMALPVTGAREMDSPITPITPPSQDRDDTASIRSAKSTKSARSKKSTQSQRTVEGGTRLSLISAAKTRSHRTSKSSLRLPKAKMPAPPPLPDLPLEFASPIMRMPMDSARASSQMLRDTESQLSTIRSRRTSLSDIHPPRPSTSSYAPTVTMDDIYVRLQSRFSDDIEVVPRTPPARPPIVDQPSKSIPNVWLMADAAPKSAAERVASLSSKRSGASSANQTYRKLKILTKRYSMPFPLFKRASAETQIVSPAKSVPAGPSYAS